MVGRNDPCHCGSGKKYKKCCLEKESHLTVLPGGKGKTQKQKPKPVEISPELQETAEKLELHPEYFFTEDILQFYIEKTTGKSKGTVLKYRSILKVVGQALLGAGAYGVDSWDDVTMRVWDELISFDFLEIITEPSYNQGENFYSVLPQFVKWLDKKYGQKNVDSIKYIIDQYKPEIMNSIYIQVVLFYKRSENVRKRIAGEQELPDVVHEGLFMVDEIGTNNITTYEIGMGKKYVIQLPKEIMDNKAVIDGMVFHAILHKTRESVWEVEDVETIYPPQALPYVQQNFLG